MATIKYPYMPAEGTIEHVSMNNQFMRQAKEHARKYSLDKAMPNASIAVKNGKVIGRGANGSTYHDIHGCERVRQGIPTGQDYELCEGCHPKNHSEPKAIKDTLSQGHDPADSELYLWGHWWCCEPCWQTMLKNGVSKVYLLKGSEKLFNKDSADNIIGKQFA